jgi:hypothetical protein
MADKFYCKNCRGELIKSLFGGWGHIIATGCIKPQVIKKEWNRYLKTKIKNLSKGQKVL